MSVYNTYSKQTKDQLKNKTKQAIAKALEKDGWENESSRGATQGYRNPANSNKVVIHPHPRETLQTDKLRKDVFDATGWIEEDLVRLKLIRKPKSKRQKNEGLA